MKKKIIILVTIIVLLAAIISAVLVFSNKKNTNDGNNNNEKIDENVISVLTIDINPSIEIGLNKDNIVVSIKALNDDAKDIISDVKNQKIEDALSKIINNLNENNYFEKDNILLVNVVSDNPNLKGIISEKLDSESILLEKGINVIMQDVNPSEELAKIAEENNISVSKAYYIKSQIEDKKDVKIDDLKDSSIGEIKEKVEEIQKKKDLEKKTEETTKNAEVKQNTNTTNTNNTTNNERIGSITQCERIKEVFSKQDMYAAVKAKVSDEIKSWIGGSYDAYATLYNGKCAWRMDLVDGNTDHSYIYDIATGQMLADNARTCLACTYTQILSLVAKYHNVSESDIKISTAELGVCGQAQSDANYTLNGTSHKLVFNRFTGAVISAS